MKGTGIYQRGGLRPAALVSLVGALLSLALASPAQADGGNANPGVIPPNAHPYGHTYGEWSNIWWQWAFSIPVHDAQGNILNPLADRTGARCGVGQSGPVWFLGGLYNDGGTVSRNCMVPPGKALLFPLVSIENENITWPPHDPPYTEQELRDQVEELMQWWNGCPGCVAEVDGVPIQGMTGDGDRIGYGNPAFSVTIPEDNLFAYTHWPAAAGTVYPVINDGWFLMLTPLAAGQHTIHFAAFDGGMDITYNLTVAH